MCLEHRGCRCGKVIYLICKVCVGRVVFAARKIVAVVAQAPHPHSTLFPRTRTSYSRGIYNVRCSFDFVVFPAD